MQSPRGTSISMSSSAASIRAWIAELATAVARLDTEQLKTMACNHKWDGPEQFPSAGQLQRLLALSTSDSAVLARHLSQVMAMEGVRSHDLGIALASFAQERSMGEREKEEVEIVCTAPSRLGIPLRATFSTVLEMVQKANHEILVVGYLFTEGASKVVEELARARRDRRVRVTFIGNRMQEHLHVLRSYWPADSPGPIIFSRESDPSDEKTSLHAKLLICDRSLALITSANFSHHGLHENIEIGAKIKSPSIARLAEFFQAMIQASEFRSIDLVSGMNW